MLSEADLFHARESFSPRKRAIYDTVLMVSIALAAVVGVLIVAGLSAILAYWLIDSDVSTDGLFGAVLMPATMAYVFVLGGIRRRYYAGESAWINMRRVAWRNFRAGMGVGFVIVAAAHYLGQLLMTRAMYGPLEFQRQVSSYCGPIPLLYGLVFAIPVGLGSAFVAAYVLVSSELIYRLVDRLPLDGEQESAA